MEKFKVVIVEGQTGIKGNGRNFPSRNTECGGHRYGHDRGRVLEIDGDMYARYGVA